MRRPRPDSLPRLTVGCGRGFGAVGTVHPGGVRGLFDTPGGDSISERGQDRPDRGFFGSGVWYTVVPPSSPQAVRRPPRRRRDADMNLRSMYPTHKT